MKKLISAIFLLFFTTGIHAQSNDTLMIKTSAVCETCKETIEKYLSYEKGVRSSLLDVDSKMLTVVYDPKKTEPAKIRLAVTKSGYNADSLKADPKAFNRLPGCCKKPHDE